MKQRLKLVVLVCCMASQILIGSMIFPTKQGTMMVSAQRPLAAREAFDVASIRPSSPTASGGARGEAAGGCSGGPRGVEPNRLVVTNATLYTLIALAYAKGSCLVVSKSALISGGQEWIRSDKFDIQALMPEGSPYTRYSNCRTARLRDFRV